MDELAELGEGYRLAVAGTVKAGLFATYVLHSKTSNTGAKQNAARTAILLTLAQNA